MRKRLLRCWKRGGHCIGFSRNTLLPSGKLLHRMAGANDEACRIFTSAQSEANALYNVGRDAEILALHVFDMLSDVWKQIWGQSVQSPDH